MAYTCPGCQKVSHNPEDERQRYCGACHRFETVPLPLSPELWEMSAAVMEAIASVGAREERWDDSETPEDHRVRCGICLQLIQWQYVVGEWAHALEPEDAHEPKGPPFCRPAGMPVWLCKDIDLCDCFEFTEEDGQ